MVAARQQRRSRRRADRRGVEPRVPQPGRGEPLEGRRVARATKGAGGTEANIIDQHDQHVRRTRRRPQWPDRRELGLWVLGVVADQARILTVRDRQDLTLNVVFSHALHLHWLHSAQVSCPHPGGVSRPWPASGRSEQHSGPMTPSRKAPASTGHCREGTRARMRSDTAVRRSRGILGVRIDSIHRKSATRRSTRPRRVAS